MEGSCDLELGLRLRSNHEVDDQGRAATKEAGTTSERTQREHLTILYKGEVCIYENVSKVQARAIMLLAGGGERPSRSSEFDAGKGLSLSPSLPATLQRGGESAASGMSIERCSTAASARMMKRSLQRFLQKRKLRMQKPCASPY